MRIIKYLFLLLLLSLVAFTIYIATQKGNFTVESNKVINSPRAIVFNYVNDYKNWEQFSSWITSDSNIRLSYSPVTIGKGSALSWNGVDTGKIQTLYTKENETIVQKMLFNGITSEVTWHFKDTVGGTKVTWKSNGKMDFRLKVDSFLYGEMQNFISEITDQSLTDLNKMLYYEISTYTVKVNGMFKKFGTYYLKQSFTSKISDITRNAAIVFPKIATFCEQNDIPLNGRPFIIYHNYDTINNLSKVSFCVPIKEEIFTSEGSDILSGKLAPFTAIKTTLTGDYKYNKKALEQSSTYFKNHKLIPDPSFSHIEIFTIGNNEVKNPSKWITNIYYPIKPAVILVKKDKAVVPSTIQTTPPPSKKAEESEF